MKIALISPNVSHLDDLEKALRSASHAITRTEGGKTKMHQIAHAEQPDIIIVEGMCCDLSELTLIEQITSHFPSMAILLLCATHTPEFLINSMRAGVREVLPSPAPAPMLQAAVARVQAKLRGRDARAPGKILAFVSCKGGSGATFLATNLGHQLAESRSVLLIDLNFQFGDALSFVYDGKPASTLADVARDIKRLDASFLAASTVLISRGYTILAAPEEPSEAMEIKPEHIEAILDLAVTQYDFILLDVARVLDTLSIRALDRCDKIFPVFQPGIPALRNTAKFLELCDSLGYPASKIAPIANRFDKGGEISMDVTLRTLKLSSIHTVPNSFKEVNASINQGTPLAMGGRPNPVTRNLAEFALALAPRQDTPRNLISRLFKRA